MCPCGLSGTDSISFGLVNIPIGLAVATQRSDIAFRTLHRECGTPIKQKRWCPFHERDVEPDELVKGWEVAKGEFVTRRGVGSRGRRAPALRNRSRSSRFVKLADVDPVYFDRTYYLAPASADAAAAALRAAAPGDAGDGDGGGREVRALGQENLSPDPRTGTTPSRSRRCSSPTDVRSKAEIEEAVEATDVQDAVSSSSPQQADRRARRRVRTRRTSRTSTATTLRRCSRRSCGREDHARRAVHRDAGRST